ncbi:MAG: pilus assembly protein [Acidobacteria bacterium]|nr:pilus assembly protein [Acidobacteriota bacterium]MCI0724686.1 pilus assembly protein [Acidobacteriota bacterium]
MTNRHTSKLTISANERGAELVEFALVFPLFMLLMVGIIEFGRAYNVYENVIHATREGVRAASADCLTGGNCTPGSYSKLTPAQIRTKIRAHLGAINITVADSDIIIDNATDLVVGGFMVNPASGGSQFNRDVAVYNVRVNYNYDFLFLNKVLRLVVPSSSVGTTGVLINATVEMMDEAESPA